MGGKRVLLLLGLCALGTGCGHEAPYVRNLAYEGARVTDDLVLCVRTWSQAHAAWADVQRTHPHLAQSHSYKCGFKEGYEDYLDSGPLGGPPPLPPRRYWNTLWKTPEGQLAISDWYAGFRHGMATAAASGQRELITVPSAFSSAVYPTQFALPPAMVSAKSSRTQHVGWAVPTVAAARDSAPSAAPHSEPLAQSTPPPRVLRAAEGEPAGRAVVRINVMPEPTPERAHWHETRWGRASHYHPGTWMESSHGQLVSPGLR